jgi:kynurenine formamidase
MRFSLILLLLAVVLAAPGKRASAEPLDLASARLVDLTHAFGPETLYWPTSPSGFELKELHRGTTRAGFFYSAYAFCAPEHGGTHLDAPFHFADGRWKAAEVPLERLVGSAVVVDIGAQAEKNPDYTLTVADLEAWETEHGRIPQGAIFLLRTGWSARWPDARAYLGDDKPGDASGLQFPSFGAEAVAFLIEKRGVGLIGVDTASIDPGTSRDFPVHRLAAAANLPALENLANLGELPPTGATVIALPMKIARGSGAPTRVIALLPE